MLSLWLKLPTNFKNAKPRVFRETRTPKNHVHSSISLDSGRRNWPTLGPVSAVVPKEYIFVTGKPLYTTPKCRQTKTPAPFYHSAGGCHICLIDKHYRSTITGSVLTISPAALVKVAVYKPLVRVLKDTVCWPGVSGTSSTRCCSPLCNCSVRPC